MNDERRSTIMARIRHATGRSGESAEKIRAQLESLGNAPAAPLPRPDLSGAFLVNVLKNQGTVDCATTRTGAVAAIARFLYQNFRTQKLVAGNDTRLAALPWRDGGLLPRFDSAEDGEQAALSYARMAVAETGSIVTFTGKANPARNNLLPESHIVLVDQDDLVATLDQALEKIDRVTALAGRPRGINMISGPSSTADIEMQLVKGAHGPRSWHVILIGADAESALATIDQSAL